MESVLVWTLERLVDKYLSVFDSYDAFTDNFEPKLNIIMQSGHFVMHTKESEAPHKHL